MKIRPTLRGKVTLPGDKDPLGVYVIDNYAKVLAKRQQRIRKIVEERKRQQQGGGYSPPAARSSKPTP
jgi:hypothetical protein